MSASSNSAQGNGHSDGHHGDGHGGGHGSFKSYMIGFVLSVILTIIPFYIVMGDALDNRIWAVAIIFALGAVQMVVHVYYFLHMNSSAEEGWLAMSMVRI